MISPILPDSVPLAIWYSEGCRSRRVIPIRCCRRGVREPRNSSSVPVVRDRCLSSTQKTGRYSRFFVSEAYAKGIRRGMGLMTEYGNADWPVDRGIGQNGCRCCFWRKANKKALKRSVSQGQRVKLQIAIVWCREPESNRHGVSTGRF